MSSDPFDDPFFANIDLAELDACEAQAITTTQARYHHTVNSPHLGKPPRPLNTEPRAGGQSTFGFGEGGKHAHPANASRYVDNVRKRKEYWGLHRDDDEVDDLPNLTVDAAGRYGLTGADPENDIDPEEGLVIDLHAPGARARAIARRASVEPRPPTTSQAAMARRAAIAESAAEALQQTAKSLTSTSRQHQFSRPGDVSSLTAGPSRLLSRSVSAGNHVFAKRPAAVGLEPIASQTSSSQTPASQGSQIRRSVFELDAERRRGEELEAQVRRLTEDLVKAQSSKNHWTDGLGVNTEHSDGHRLEELQTELWKAKGEAATMRRTQQEEMNRHQADVDKLRKRIAEMERSFAEKERENIARIESVKSQAVFATHAAMNSTGKGKAKAQRPTTPTHSQNGSPQRRRNVTVPADDIRSVASSPPGHRPPRFNGLHNAFAEGPRAKHFSPIKKDLSTATETLAIAADFPPACLPGSPRGLHQSHAQAAEVDIDVGTHAPTGLLRSLIAHTLSYSNVVVGHDSSRRSSIQRILQFRPCTLRQEYTQCCSGLLRALSERHDAVTDHAIPEALGRLYGVLVDSLTSPLAGDESQVVVDVLGLVSSVVFLFPSAFNPDVCQALAASSRRLVDRFLRVQKSADETFQRRDGRQSPSHDGPAPFAEVIHYLARLCEGLCWMPDNRAWTGDHLAYIIYALAHPAQHEGTVAQTIQLFRAASCNPALFRAVTASSGDSRPALVDTNVPLQVIERMSRYLATPHVAWSASKTLACQAHIIRALSMLTCADDDAVVLLAEHSALIPGLIRLLHCQSTRIVGTLHDESMSRSAMSLVTAGLYLLHHLVFPAPATTHLRSRMTVPLSQRPYPVHDRDSASRAPQGIDLQARLFTAAACKEWAALPHMFVSALGALSYCDLIWLPDDDQDERLCWRVVQYLAQDLLESVVEGPEADDIYEVYSNGAARQEVASMDIDEAADEDEYAALRDVIVID